MKKTLTLIAIVTILFSCQEKKEVITVSDLATLAEEYVVKVEKFESQKDPMNPQTFMDMDDSISIETAYADTALAEMFASMTDTIFLKFEQTENLNRINILKAYVVGVKYNKLQIEAIVEALDNSSVKGPYTSISGFGKDETGKEVNLGVGGGIFSDPSSKVIAGETYVFTGNIDYLHKLIPYTVFKFDEDIKKW